MKNCHFEEWLKSSDSEIPSRIESSLSSVIEICKSAWYATASIMIPGILKYFQASTVLLQQKLTPVFSLLDIKESSNSCPIISIKKYMEEFPGLVHFLYIDRSGHRLTTPTLFAKHQRSDISITDETSVVEKLTASKVWSMVEFARQHLVDGRTSIIWKDKTFSYSYFLWFEDDCGNPLKPLKLSNKDTDDIEVHTPENDLSIPPGIICGDFYKHLACKVLPKHDIKHVRIFELFCIHLGLTTSPCILEQTRRLAATVWEISGYSSTKPRDLL